MKLRGFLKNRSMYDLLGMPLMIFFIAIGLGEAIISNRAVMREAFVPSLVFVVVYLGLVFAVPDDRRQRHRRRSRLIFITFAAVIVITSLTHYLGGGDDVSLFFDMLAGIYFAVLMLLLMVLTVADLMRSNTVSIKMVISGFCGYLMMALAWQNIYHAMQLIGIQVFETPLMGSGADYTDIYIANFYFSLVTISTLGYGDFVPVGNLPRMVAAAEAVAGQFYITVLIGILVGKYLRDSKTNRQD